MADFNEVASSIANRERNSPTGRAARFARKRKRDRLKRKWNVAGLKSKDRARRNRAIERIVWEAASARPGEGYPASKCLEEMLLSRPLQGQHAIGGNAGVVSGAPNSP